MRNNRRISVAQESSDFLAAKIFTAQKMKFSIKDFFSKFGSTDSCGLVIFTEEILNGKLHFCAAFRTLLNIYEKNTLTLKRLGGQFDPPLWFF